MIKRTFALYIEDDKSDIVYVEDTNLNQQILEEKLGPPTILGNRTYLEVNINQKTWRECFTFEWLYRNGPVLVDIDELIDEL